MPIAGEILQQFQSVKRLYELSFKSVSEKYGLSQIELSILMFLHTIHAKIPPVISSNLGAAESECIEGVESLIQKGLMLRAQDMGDRRASI